MPSATPGWATPPCAPLRSVTGMAGMTARGRTGRSDRLDRVFDLDLAGLLEFEGRLDVLALLQRLLEPHQHDVEGSRFELDRLPRLDFEPALDRAHLHDTPLHQHPMHFNTRSDIGRSADQPVG